MDAEEKSSLLNRAKELRAESERLSALLLLPEVCSDKRLALHYGRRIREIEPVLMALEECGRAGDDAAFASLRRELLLLSVSGDAYAHAYVGAGVCMRAPINIKEDGLRALWRQVREELIALLPAARTEVCTESGDRFAATFSGENVFDVLSALKAGDLGANVRFAVYPVLPTPEIRDEDVRTDVFLNGGKGGQNVNKVETAVRLTHLPTGVSVTCRDERSQLQNKKRAAKLLRERVAAHYREAQLALLERAKRSLE